MLLGVFKRDEYRFPLACASNRSKESPHFKSFVCGDFLVTPAGCTDATVEVSRIENPAVGRGGWASFVPGSVGCVLSLNQFKCFKYGCYLRGGYAGFYNEEPKPF